jgi:hypothetical protein
MSSPVSGELSTARGVIGDAMARVALLPARWWLYASGGMISRPCRDIVNT